MVAKSYQSFKQVGDPYERNGRTYIQVMNSKNTIKEVRWYSEKEYENIYGPIPNKINDARKRFGFFPNDKLYIAIADKDILNQFFTQETHHFGRYCNKWGWYVGVWAKEFNKEELILYKARMKELNIHFYCLDYAKISDKNGNILPWEDMKVYE